MEHSMITTPATSHTPDPIQQNLALLASNPNIIILQADKNLGMAILDYDHYKTLTRNYLSDENVYEPIPIDANFDSRIQQIYKRFHNIMTNASMILTKQEIAFLWSTLKNTHTLPKFRTIPKLHKTIPTGYHPTLQLRPIVGATNYITTNASIFVAEKLKPFFANDPLRPTNSTSIINTLESLTHLPSNTILFSFDVVNLYGSMDIILTTQAVHRFCVLKNLPLLIAQLVNWILINNYSTFDDTIYRQKTGMAMGTNMAVLVANVFMFIHFENHPLVLETTKNHIIGYNRYVDDIFGIWTSTPDTLLLFFNQCQTLIRGIKFTIEQSTSSINFLDLTISIKDNHPHFTCHQKSLNTYTYITNRSAHPIALKKGFIKGELIRYIRNSSLESDFNSLRSTFKIRLLRRGYSNNFINNTFNSVSYSNRRIYLSKRPPPTPVAPFVIRFNNRIHSLTIGHHIKHFSNQITTSGIWPNHPRFILALKSNPSLIQLFTDKRSKPIHLKAHILD